MDQIINTIIFDFDGVLSPDNTTKIFSKYKSLIKDPLFGIKVIANKKLYQCMRGEISFLDLNKEFSRISNLDLITASRISDDLINSRVLDKKVFDLVVRAKEKGLMTVLFTDNMKVPYDTWVRKFKLKDYFDILISSSQIGAMKSDKKSFEMLFRMIKKEPGECFFIDDRKSNIYMAKKFGMQGIVFKNNIDLVLSELEKYRIII